MRVVNGTEYTTGEIVATWTRAGSLAGMAIGGTYGTVLFPIVGTAIGAVAGAIAGLVVGVLDGLLLAWIRPSPADVPLVAEASTELVLLPVQIWLWIAIHSVLFLPLVVAPSVVGVAVAALLGRRLPPAPGPGGSRGPGRGRDIAGGPGRRPGSDRRPGHLPRPTSIPVASLRIWAVVSGDVFGAGPPAAGGCLRPALG
jgi:hypothetical protein